MRFVADVTTSNQPERNQPLRLISFRAVNTVVLETSLTCIWIHQIVQRIWNFSIFTAHKNTTQQFNSKLLSSSEMLCRMLYTHWYCKQFKCILISKWIGMAQSVQRLDTWSTVWASKPGRVEIFRTRPQRLWVPPSLLYNEYRDIPDDKAAGAWRWLPIPT